jgi:hypothetical protein
MHYDINDFLLNNNNKLFKVKILLNYNSNLDKNENAEFISIIFNYNKKQINFFKTSPSKGLSYIKIVPNNYVNVNDSIFGKTKYIEDNNFIVKIINDLINKREDDIIHFFNFFENSKNNGVNELSKIIEIKERLIKENPD